MASAICKQGLKDTCLVQRSMMLIMAQITIVLTMTSRRALKGDLFCFSEKRELRCVEGEGAQREDVCVESRKTERKGLVSSPTKIQLNVRRQNKEITSPTILMNRKKRE